MDVKSAAVEQHLHPAPVMTWVDYIPSNIRPFFLLARFHKPAGPLVSLYPHTLSVTMACYAHNAPITTVCTRIALLFATFEMFRAAGCVVNDMLDKDLDALIPRTQTRPLPSGQVSMFQASVFVVLLLAISVWPLMQLNQYTFRLAFSCLGFIALYPLMKRVTYWPQLVVGICVNWGVLVGAASVVGAVDWHVYLPLYMGAICWTMVYETAYARQDREEDIKHGMHSTTILFGEKIRPILAMFSFVSCSLMAYAGIRNGHGYPFFVGVTIGTAQLIRYLATADFENKESCDAALLDCSWFGFWASAGAMADYAMKTQF